MPLSARTHLRERYMDEQLGTAALDMTSSVTVRRIVNTTALTVVDAGAQRGEHKALL